MKHTELNGCALTEDCRFLISGRNQRRPRPIPCISVTKTQRISFRNGVKEIYDFEILISGTERRPALYEFSLKKYSDKGLKEGHWGVMCEGKHGNVGHYEESQIYCVLSTVCAEFYRNDVFTTDI